MKILKVARKEDGQILAENYPDPNGILRFVNDFCSSLLNKVYHESFQRPEILLSDYLKVVEVQYGDETSYVLAFAITNLKPTIDINRILTDRDNFYESVLTTIELNIGKVVWGFQVKSLEMIMRSTERIDLEIDKIFTVLKK